MKIALHITVEVDADDWCREYGIERRAVRADVRQYVETALAECPVPLLPVARPPKPAAEPAQTSRPGDATTGTPATPGGKETGEPTPGGPQDARRGGEVRAVQPPPAAAVLAGAESRPDSGPTTLPDPRKGPGCRTAAGHPGPLRPAVPEPAADREPLIAGPLTRGRRRRAALTAALAAVATAVVMLVGTAPGAGGGAVAARTRVDPAARVGRRQPAAAVGRLMARHRAPDQPDRPDPRPDRIGAHEPSPFRPDQVPAEQLLRRLHTQDGDRWTR